MVIYLGENCTKNCHSGAKINGMCSSRSNTLKSSVKLKTICDLKTDNLYLQMTILNILRSNELFSLNCIVLYQNQRCQALGKMLPSH